MQTKHFTFLSLLTFLFVVPSVYGQTTSINVLSQLGYNRIGSDFWASGGAGIAEQGLRASAFANPALLSFNSLTLTAESAWRPKTDYLSGIEYDNTTLLPSYASVGFSVASISIETGYSRSYDERFFLGNVMITTEAQPDGTGQYATVENRSSIQTAFVSMSYTISEGISVGLTGGLDYIQYDGNLPYYSTHATGRRLQLTVGVVARPFETASFGLTAHIAASSNLDNSGEPPVRALTIDSSRNVTVLLPTALYKAETPSSVEIGGAVNVLPWLTLLGSAEYQNWSAMGNYLDDIWQYHVGAATSPIPEATFRAGFFTQRSSSTPLKEYFNEYFLTAGASWKVLESLTVSIAYMTSAPFTKKSISVPYFYFGESLQQSMLSGGVSFSW